MKFRFALPEAEQIFDRDVLVDRFPANAEPAADKPPRLPLLRRGILKPRKPRQRNRDGTPIRERDPQRVVAAHNVHRKWPDIYRRKAHNTITR